MLPIVKEKSIQWKLMQRKYKSDTRDRCGFKTAINTFNNLKRNTDTFQQKNRSYKKQIQIVEPKNISITHLES